MRAIWPSAPASGPAVTLTRCPFVKRSVASDMNSNPSAPELFSKYTSIEDFANADVVDIERIIMSCGLYKSKARSIVEMCRKLLDSFGGEIPSTIEELTTLPGIGRKTANLIMGDVFHKAAYVADTHCIRICRRLGLTDSADPLKTENELRDILPPERSSDFCHRLVMFGREVCTARKPRCDECPLRERCEKTGV